MIVRARTISPPPLPPDLPLHLNENNMFVKRVAESKDLRRPHQSRARRALTQFKDIPLRTKRALSLYKVYGDSILLVLNGTSLKIVNAILALSQQAYNWKLTRQSQKDICCTVAEIRELCAPLQFSCHIFQKDYS